MQKRDYGSYVRCVAALMVVGLSACTPKSKEGEACFIDQKECADDLICFRGWQGGAVSGETVKTEKCMTVRDAKAACRKSVTCAEAGKCNLEESGTSRVCLK